MGLGVIDVKRTEIENPDNVARSIEQAEQAMGAGRIRHNTVHPDWRILDAQPDDRRWQDLALW